MDPFSRLSRHLGVGVVLAAVCVVAGAVDCPKIVTKYAGTWTNPQGEPKVTSYGSTPASACAAAGAETASAFAGVVGSGSTTQTVSFSYTGGPEGTTDCTDTFVRHTVYGPGYGLGAAPFDANTSKAVGLTSRQELEECDSGCANKAGKAAGAKGQELSMPSVGPGGGVPTKGCDANNCQIGKPQNAGGLFGKLNGEWTYTDLDASSWTVSGQACGPTDARSSAPAKCPAKQCPGQVNGATVCVPCESTTTADTKKTTAPDPAASGASAPPATSTTTKTTNCEGGKCTTTTETTGTGVGGTTTKTETAEQSEQSFCAENPKSDQCADDEEDKKSFSGSCSAVSCEGDAIMCAIAKEQQKRNCELFDQNAASDRGIAASTAGDKPGDHPGKTPTETAFPGTFDKTDLIGGNCPADVPVSMPGGHNVVLPFSMLCGPAGVLGNILIGITALACLGIVFVRGS